jgi:8-oxo-dGTP pyrophosphatase MutT (NUDIX family)
MKKIGQGHGNYNGFGGKKTDEDKDIEATALRELTEESGLSAQRSDLEHNATIEFYFPSKPEWNQRVRVYFVRAWHGEPRETEEMKPEWFPLDAMPYHRMWDSDRRWLPLLLCGKKIKAGFTWKEDNKTVDTYNIEEM